MHPRAAPGTFLRSQTKQVDLASSRLAITEYTCDGTPGQLEAYGISLVLGTQALPRCWGRRGRRRRCNMRTVALLVIKEVNNPVAGGAIRVTAVSVLSPKHSRLIPCDIRLEAE